MKKTLHLLFLFVLCLPSSLLAQIKHDYVWAHGAGSINLLQGYMFGGTLLDFKQSPPALLLTDFIVDFPFASISDKYGNLIAYTDGCRIANKNNDLMLNGDTLNPGKVFNSYCSYPWNQFYPIVQPCTFLPKPGSDSLYYLFHLRSDDKYRNPMNLLYSEIDATADNGNGAVLHKNKEVFSDSLYVGQFLTATRHANGRDWWVVVTRRFNSEIYVTLVTPDTVQYMGMQDVGFTEVDSAFCCNQTRFTPDGSRFFRNHPGGMLILDFDRCTGKFSNPVYWDYSITPIGSGGVSFSYDGRFLYLSIGIRIEQYDLQAADIIASREVVAEYDGYLSPFETYFFHAQLGPDGKIYVLSNTNNNVLHIIHHPERKGLACEVEQHGLQMPAMGSFFEPNFPNYRLGPIDGSSCDTLDIDNLPVAHFRWEVNDTLSPLNIEFTDLSYFEPATWLWDFGDGVMSQDTSPVHAYSMPGTYQVCLTVCNPNACSTECMEVTIETVGTVTLSEQDGTVLLSPNPAAETLRIQSEDVIEQVRVFDTTGKEWMSLLGGGQQQMTLDVSRLSAGLYFILVKTGAGVWSGKFERLAR